jgi:hypothetical protein
MVGLAPARLVYEFNCHRDWPESGHRQQGRKKTRHCGANYVDQAEPLTSRPRIGRSAFLMTARV